MGDMLDTGRLEAFAAEGAVGPFRLLTLLRFQARASYPDSADDPGLTGRQAYERYLEQLTPLIEQVGGSMIHYGVFQGTLLGEMPANYDAMTLIRYPDRTALMRMLGAFEYTRIAIHRVAALDDSVVLAMPEGESAT